MQAELWKKIEELYQAALLQPPEKRAWFIQQATFGNPELCAEVESLLKAAGEESSFLGGSPISYGPSEASIGAIIGPYHLLQLIGQGGMGEVWLADQKQPIRRRVAIKLIKAGMDTREVVARFQSERQALALMDHPSIAKVFDAGSTSLGHPYFVMEHVPGIPITDYCDTHKLTVPERLRLFIQVCEGVKHAHQKAIIHRDLKPSNILVAQVDDKPVPKIIDFGVAKAISQRLTEDTLVTRAGAPLGTRDYMSPEQADSAGEDIDTRADVYSLGVILYELLVGTVPFDLRKLTFGEMLRKLREEDAPRPSTKLGALGEQSAIAAQNRRIEPKALARQLRGDLDSIVLKALEKERARRYEAPSELAADIERYLGDETVGARQASAGYQAWKYVRRHRVGVGFAAALALLLTAAAAVSSWMALRASRAEQEAQAVNDFLRNDVLAQASVDQQDQGPANKPNPNLEVRTALDRAAVKIGGKFDRQPVVEASIRQTIGATYFYLGLYPQAEPQLRRALELRERMLGEENHDTLLSKHALAALQERQGRFKEAEKLFDETIRTQRSVFGNEHPDTLSTELELAGLYVLAGKYAEGETLNRQLLSVQRRRLGQHDPNVLKIENNLASVYIFQGKYAQGEEIERSVVDAMLRVNGEESRDTLAAMTNLATLYGFEEKFALSEALYRKAVDGLLRLEGKEDHHTLLAMEGLAWACDHEGKYPEADALFSEVLGAESRVLGKDHPQTLVVMTDMAASYRRRAMYKQAETLLVKVVEGRRRKLGAGIPETLASMGDLGWLYVTEGKYAQADPVLREAANTFETAGSHDWERFRVMCALGASFVGQKQYAQAEPLLVDGYRQMMELRNTIPADGSFELEQAGGWIVKLYRDWGKPEKADEWRQKLNEAGLSISPNR